MKLGFTMLFSNGLFLGGCEMRISIIASNCADARNREGRAFSTRAPAPVYDLPMTNPVRFSGAVHEAGHALVAHALSAPVGAMSVANDGAGKADIADQTLSSRTG